MEAKAVARFVRMSPRKVRLVADEIRGYAVGEALDILKFTNKRAIEPLTKVILSASANATVLNDKVDSTQLFIKKILRGRRTDYETFSSSCQRSRCKNQKKN